MIHRYNVKEIKEKIKKINAYAIDMDGTIYLGKKIFPFTKSFLNGLESAGKKYVFLTNNSSKNSEDYSEKLQKMGIKADRSRIYTSGDATIEYLKKLKPGANLFLMGTENLINDFRKAGFSIVREKPDFVVLGFDLTFNYDKFAKAARFIRNGVQFIATHPDFNCPMENGDMIPDCGAISSAFTAATGVKPKVIGKPNEEMLYGLLNRLKIKKEELCLMGDRLMTDIAMGQKFGVLSILVLTGEANRKDLENSEIIPDFVLERNVDLLNYLDI